MAGKPGATKLREITEPDIEKISAMSGLGLNMTQISHILKVSKRTLEREMHRNPAIADAVERGRASAILKVSKTAYDLAISGKQPEMTRFYLKCRAGWTEKLDITQHIKQEIIFATKIGEDGVLKTIETGKEKLQIEDVLDSELL